MVQNKRVKDLLGKKFNRLTVVKYLGLKKYQKHWWLCECECGGLIELPTSGITSNTPTKSCGCLRKEKLLENRKDSTKHGHTINNKKLYSIYSVMKYRCYNPNSKRWKYYGGKGVIICEEWLENVDNFISWSHNNGYKEGLSINRIDSNKDYSPENCEWITRSENSRKMNEFRRYESFIRRGTKKAF